MVQYRLVLGVMSAVLVAGLVLGLGSQVAWAQAAAGDRRLVEIHDRGVTRTILTKATTVRQALAEAAVGIDETYDVVEPGLEVPLDGSGQHLRVYRARPVTVVDGLQRSKVLTAARTPVAMARAAGVTLYDEDSVRLLPPSQALTQAGAGPVLQIERAQQRREVIDQAIAPPVQTTQDKGLPIGQRQVRQPGVAGLQRVTYLVRVDRAGHVIERRQLDQAVLKAPQPRVEVVGARPLNPLTKAKGAHVFTDSRGASHRETYYDLPMNVVMRACGAGGHYTVREDGAKVDKDGYVIVAANYGNYPRCSLVETSLGPGKVYDTGGFALRHPHGFDLATDWTKVDGR